MGLLAIGICHAQTATTASGLDPKQFKQVYEDKPVELYTLTNQNGMEACVTNFGARLVSLMVPNREGTLQDVVTGYDNINSYTRFKGGTFGATVGRYANRISHGRFVLDGATYELPVRMRRATDGRPHVLHGELSGFHDHVWSAIQPDAQTVVLSYLSLDGDGGFPGTLRLTVTYHLNDENALHITYYATTDRPTVLNLTNHSYFNLTKLGTTVADQWLQVNSQTYTVNDSDVIPTGEFASVAGTPLDLRKLTQIGESRFNDNWVLDAAGDLTKEVARAVSKTSGIVMQVYTTEPGLQVYSGIGPMRGGKQGINYPAQGAFCLETQHYPDSPNRPEFPSTVLRPDKPYHSETIYKFLVEK
jgi:aldose 1-epimerase